MPEAWRMATIPEGADPREEWRQSPNVAVSLEELKALGVLYWNIRSDAELDALCAERGYANRDEVRCACTGPEMSDMLKTFFTEHIHEDEEIRLVMDGAGYFDVRSADDQWIRIHVVKDDLLILPAGIYHRFTVVRGGGIHAKRIFKEAPKWIAINRPCDDNPYHQEYLKSIAQ